MLYAGLCLNNSQLVVVGLVLFAFFCHTFQMLQQRLDTYDTSTSSSDSNSQVPRRYSQLTAAFRTATGAPMQSEAVPWQTGLLRLIFIGRSFNEVLPWV